jgi:hypothetical protein
VLHSSRGKVLGKWRRIMSKKETRNPSEAKKEVEKLPIATLTEVIENQVELLKNQVAIVRDCRDILTRLDSYKEQAELLKKSGSF